MDQQPHTETQFNFPFSPDSVVNGCDCVPLVSTQKSSDQYRFLLYGNVSQQVAIGRNIPIRLLPICQAMRHPIK